MSSLPPPLPRSQTRRVPWALVVLLVAAGLGFVFFVYVATNTWRALTAPPETGEHVARVDWLPKEATDVSFFRSYGFTAYEFTIPEEGFKNWAKRWEVEEIHAPIKISRYNFFEEGPDSPKT